MISIGYNSGMALSVRGSLVFTSCMVPENSVMPPWRREQALNSVPHMRQEKLQLDVISVHPFVLETIETYCLKEEEQGSVGAPGFGCGRVSVV